MRKAQLLRVGEAGKDAKAGGFCANTSFYAPGYSFCCSDRIRKPAWLGKDSASFGYYAMPHTLQRL